MDDIDEGIGSNDSIANTKDVVVDLQKGLDVLKGLNGQAVLGHHTNIDNDSNTDSYVRLTKSLDNNTRSPDEVTKANGTDDIGKPKGSGDPNGCVESDGGGDFDDDGESHGTGKTDGGAELTDNGEPDGIGEPDGKVALNDNGEPDGTGEPDGKVELNDNGEPHGTGEPDGKVELNDSGEPHGTGEPSDKVKLNDDNGEPNGTKEQNGKLEINDSGEPDHNVELNDNRDPDCSGEPDGNLELNDNMETDGTGESDGRGEVNGSGETDGTGESAVSQNIDSAETEMEVDMDTCEHAETMCELESDTSHNVVEDEKRSEEISSKQLATSEAISEAVPECTETMDVSDIVTDKQVGSPFINSEGSKKETNQTPTVKSSLFRINDKVRQSLKGLTEKVKATPENKVEPDKQIGNDKETDDMENVEDEGSDKDKLQSKTEENSRHQRDSPVDEIIDNNSNDEPVTKEENTQSEMSVSCKSLKSDDILAAATDDGFVMDIESDAEDELLRSPEQDKQDGAEANTHNPKDDNVLSMENTKSEDQIIESKNDANEGKSNEIKDSANSPCPKEKQTDIESPSDTMNSCNISKTDKSAESAHVATTESVINDKPTAFGLDPHSPIVLDQSDEVTENDQTGMDIDDETDNTKPLESKTTNEVNKDDDDDDVIFEGETKIESKKGINSSASNAVVTTIAPVSTPKKTSVSIEPVKDSIILDDDDDVIIEKEVKPEPQKVVTSADTGSPVTTESTSSVDVKINLNGTDNLTNTPEKQCSDAKNFALPINGFMIKNENSTSTKRPADTEGLEQDVKRTKLTLKEPKGESVKMSALDSIELSDSDDADTKDNVKSEEKKEYQATIKTDVKNSSLVKVDKILKLTEKELNDVVMEKVKAYMMSQQTSLIAQMSHKIKELQSNNELWKKKVKDLQKKVSEVTVLQQKHEKRKAATAALRQITTRTVGVQVDDGKTASSSGLARTAKYKQQADTPTKTASSGSPRHAGSRQLQTTPTKNVITSGAVPLVTAPPGANGMIRLPIPHSAIPTTTVMSALPQSSFPGSAPYKAPTVKSLLDTTRVQMTIGNSQAAVKASSSSVISLIPFQTMVTTAAASQGLITLPQSVVTQATNNPAKTVVAKTVTIPSPGSKVIDLTEDEESSKTRIVTLAPGVASMASQVAGIPQVLQQGAQLVRSTLPNTGYQLVFNPTSPSLRPTVLPGMSPVAPSGTVLQQTVTQNNVVNLTSPTGTITQGASLARAAAAAPVAPVIQANVAPQAPPVQQTKPASLSHPATFPLPAGYKDLEQRKNLPPKPTLKISRVSQGIVLSWNMTTSSILTEIANYQLFAYQESTTPPSPTLWKKVGDVKALPLPMACTLTQFQVGNKYHFAVRAVDSKGRVGQASDASSIYLTAVASGK